MRKLHLVGLTTDRDGLIFTARKGSKSGGFIVPLDEVVLAAVAEAQAERNGAAAVKELAVAEVEAVPRRPRHQSALTPREMQARLRAGRSIDEVAAEAGVDNDWVARFAVPILAEQAQVVELARELVYAKPRLGESSQPLGASVTQNLSDRGLFLPDDVADAGWSAFQLHDSVWMVRFRYRSRGRSQEAQWEVDVPAGRLHARNRHASDLGYIEPGRRRRVVDEDELLDDTEPPAPRRPARPTSAAAKARRPPAKAAAPATRRGRAAGASARPMAARSAKAPASKSKAVKKAAPAAKSSRAAAKTTRASRTAPAAPARTSTGTGTAGRPAKAPAGRRPAKAAGAGGDAGPTAAPTGAVRSAVAQIAAARVTASMATAERSPWAGVVTPRTGSRLALANGNPGSMSPSARRASSSSAATAPRDQRPNGDDRRAFEPRPLPEGADIPVAARVRKLPAPPVRPEGGTPPVSLPAPRVPAPRQEPMPGERPKRRRLRSR